MQEAKPQITFVRADSLVGYARNSKTHSSEQVAKLVASIAEFGWTFPVLADKKGIVAGHGRVAAALRIYENGGQIQLPGGQSVPDGMVPVIDCTGWSDAKRRAYIVADNKLPDATGAWDFDMLAVELDELVEEGFDLSLLGFTSEELNELIGTPNLGPVPAEGEDDAPEPPVTPVTQAGDIWLLGNHRVMCGDSTDGGSVALLMAGSMASLVHADPPYGMGKEGDGVANDNLYREKLDEFQMAWWRTFRKHTDPNVSAYIWGNSPDLWRLWYAGGLADSENLYFCNHIVWDKKSIPGMASDMLLQYPTATEHCLFFKAGDQFVGNINADQYWEGWDVIRLYLKEQADAVSLSSKQCQAITGVQMYAHWFSKSQWSFIPEKYYKALQDEFSGHFCKEYSELRKQYEQIKGGYRSHINGIQGGMRSYFDNGHDAMRDVWEFSRVVGDERHGHATPKPVAMMERVMKSSLPKGGVCVEPFGGSGSTLIGAEKTGRVCYSMELQGIYVDVIVKRWQNFTGNQATLEGDGRTFDEIAEARLGDAVAQA